MVRRDYRGKFSSALLTTPQGSLSTCLSKFFSCFILVSSFLFFFFFEPVLQLFFFSTFSRFRNNDLEKLYIRSIKAK